VVAFLTDVGELYDKDGLASTRLAAAVGYPGSSVAFAQLLSGMERSGLIVREVHGKRTYRITLGDVEGFGPVSRAPVGLGGRDGLGGRGVELPSVRSVAAGSSVSSASSSASSSGSGSGSSAEFDYDELARRLLVQVVRRLAAEPSKPSRAAPSPAPDAVADLEHELASAWTKHGKLAEENIRLREQLRTAQRSLALARDHFRRLPITSDLDNAEVVLLQRLLQQD
jgi:hypothetical protein